MDDRIPSFQARNLMERGAIGAINGVGAIAQGGMAVYGGALSVAKGKFSSLCANTAAISTQTADSVLTLIVGVGMKPRQIEVLGMNSNDADRAAYRKIITE